MTSTIHLSVVIVNWNTAGLLRECLASVLAASSDYSPQVIVVDNASTDGSAEMMTREFSTVRLIESHKNVGFACANNLGIAASDGRYVLLLNSDTVVKPGALTSLGDAEAGAVGPRLLQSNGEPQAFAFGHDPTLPYLLRRGISRLMLKRALHDWRTTQIQEVDWVSGACLLTRRKTIDQVGLLDENFFMYFEDNDWCLQIRQAGWKVYYNPQVEIMHMGGQSLKQNPAARRAYYRSLDYFYAKHYSPLARLALRVSWLPYRMMVQY
jgi:GT2 family glycosyltransferase